MAGWSVVGLVVLLCAAGNANGAALPEGAVGENLFAAGRIEAVDGRPAGWVGEVELSRDAHSPPYALLIKSERKGQVVRPNAVINRPIGRGVVRFWIKVVKRPEGVARPFAFFVIALRGGREAAPRAAWYLPGNAPVGRWQRVDLCFRFDAPHEQVVLAPRIGEGCAAEPGAYLLDDIEVYQLGPMAEGRIEVSEPAVVGRRAVRVRAVVENAGGMALSGRAELVGDGRLLVARDVEELRPGGQVELAAPWGGGRVELFWRDGRGRRKLAGAFVPVATRPGPDVAKLRPAGSVWADGRSCGVACGAWQVAFPLSRGMVEVGFVVAGGGGWPEALVPLPEPMRPKVLGGALLLEGLRWRLRISPAGRFLLRTAWQGPAGEMGPALYMGLGRPGHGRKWALLPGLEYLPPNEDSSGWYYAIPPHCWRWNPDPRKITIPLMAAEGERAVYGWLWDAEREGMPRIYFDTPNRRQGQDNTAMAIRMPERGRLVAYLYCRPGGQVLDAVDEWIERFGLPPMPRTQRSLEEHLRWMGVEPRLQRSNLAAGLEELHRKALAALRSQRPDGSWRYEGPSERARDWLLRRVAGMLEHARRQVGDPNAFTLGAYGRAGDTAIGQMVFFDRLDAVARAALLTGDPRLVQATVRGLEFCDRHFMRPEGAETWEIPLHAPDLFAAARAVPVYMAAYKMTGDERYLRRAIYWARTGLPFVYLWSAPEREHMSYATIPVFGASYFVASWFGNAVQWIGMHYARAAMAVGEYDPSRPWRRIAEGITRRCMTMQVFGDLSDPKKRYRYPDSWNQVTDTHTGPDIHPGDVIANCLMLLGLAARTDHCAVQTDGGRLHVSLEGRVAQVRVFGRRVVLEAEVAVADPELLLGGPAAGKVAWVRANGRLVQLRAGPVGTLVGRASLPSSGPVRIDIQLR